MQYDAPSPGAFSPFTTGLDHLAFGVASGEELARWQERLEAASVSCSRTDQPELSIMAFRDPDNIQIELGTPIREDAASSVDESGTLVVDKT
jgi:glyoxylase I family protein